MTWEEIKKRIGVVQEHGRRLGTELDTLLCIDPAALPQDYERYTTSAVLRAETLTCQLRQLLFSTTLTTPEAYFAQAKTEHGIDISFENGIFTVMLPCLLPKKRQRYSSSFLLDPLQYALLEYCRQHGKPGFRECTVCVEHVYDEQWPMSAIRDYDNLQQKQVLDLITLYAMTDDSGLLCDLYQTTRLDKTACTRIHVMAKDRFPAWLKGQKSG